MPEKISLYTRSKAEAQTLGELNLWRQSHEESIRCAAEKLRQLQQPNGQQNGPSM